MSYIITVNNQVFTNKEEALKYFENNFLVENSDVSEPDKFASLISNVLPSDIKVNVTYVDGGGWGKYRIEVGNEDFMIDTYLDPEEKNTYGGLYSSIDAVTNFYGWSIPTTLKILNEVNKRYEFKSFKLDRYHDDYGNGHYFDFCYETNEGNGYRVTYEGYSDECIEEFLNKFEQHFINSLCGDFEEIREDGYFEDYMINGTPIRGLLERASRLGKKVKIEIVD